MVYMKRKRMLLQKNKKKTFKFFLFYVFLQSDETRYFQAYTFRSNIVKHRTKLLTVLCKFLSVGF